MGYPVGLLNGYFILQGWYIRGVIEFAGTVSVVSVNTRLESSLISHLGNKNGPRLAERSPRCWHSDKHET
jgi:hypothetical protein